MLKIDRSFVHHMLDDAQDRAIVEGVIGWRAPSSVVVAEGVNRRRRRALLDMGCSIGQGTASPRRCRLPHSLGLDPRYRGLFALTAATPAPGSRAAS